ncbi:MAG: UDP-N-acetylmuramoyl-tripeptide--D-alanyl-D-alanine ligase [Phycisphaerae bacterium]|nr:UDP-N-acetylmuramoyl-tripeptide--D-alanyl-D-alanine ligase [Phycisphaerae bacterium]
MKEVSIFELAGIIGAEFEGAGGTLVSGVSIDSREIKAGDCFFALCGNNFDGSEFIQKAFDKGAACAVTSGANGNERVLRVEDTIKAMGVLAGEIRSRSGFRLIAITGSVGKTTTRQMISHVLSGRFKVWQSPKNFNNHIGLPMTILGAPADTEIVVAELGSNSPGEISYLSRIAAADVGVITAVEPVHLEGFGDIETIEKEKLSIGEGLAEGGVIIDRPWRDAEVSGIRYDKGFTCFSIEGVEIELPLAGTGNIRNAITAWRVCSSMGIELEEFARSIREMRSVGMRAEIQQYGNLQVINDCYNASPVSMRNALEIISGLDCKKDGRKVFVCGDMSELGIESARFHRELGENIANAKIDVLVTTGKLSKLAAEAAENCSRGGIEIKIFEDTVSACKNLDKIIKEYDIVLVKGSRSAKLELVIERIKQVFGQKK